MFNSALAPPGARGWTHIWDGDEEQLPISDGTAQSLVRLQIISYSPDDGPHAKVYRPVKPNWTLDRIKKEVLLP